MAENILEVIKLNKAYGALQATKNLSFSVARGHIHAIIGPNGAGKTTLVNQLTGDILSDSGKILFQAQDISRLKDYRRARLGIARSFQITHIFENLTVAENMALSICAHSSHNFRFWRKGLQSGVVREKLADCLSRVDLEKRGHIVASALSHGEKRQLEVGMALTGQPDLLILDEPMAGMGPGGTVELSKLIQKLKGSTTILLVEHDMDVVFSLADMITVLVYGENILTAPPAEIRQNKDVQAAYLGEQD
ncbi:MAG: ABC transporter ATP-binding protein [Desulfopila sp.]|jgi:branched-chain amino acid transport system ATP-binding protein|nr:ABC transporter ATP-binding protein [Desulfopila sp.]